MQVSGIPVLNSSETAASWFVDVVAGRVLSYSNPWQLNAYVEEASMLLPIARFREYRSEASAATIQIINQIEQKGQQSHAEKVVKIVCLAVAGLMLAVCICLLAKQCHGNDEDPSASSSGPLNYNITPLILGQRETTADDESLVSRMRADSLQGVSYKVFNCFNFR